MANSAASSPALRPEHPREALVDVDMVFSVATILLRFLVGCLYPVGQDAAVTRHLAVESVAGGDLAGGTSFRAEQPRQQPGGGG